MKPIALIIRSAITSFQLWYKLIHRFCKGTNNLNQGQVLYIVFNHGFVCERLVVNINCAYTYNMQTDLSKGSHTRSFKPHFSLTSDRYNNNRLTVHVYTMAKSSTVWPHLWACMTSTGAWVVFIWLQLAWPNKQLARNHHKTGWWDWAMI